MRIMKHLCKRGLALFMALFLCLSLLPVQAMAQDIAAEPTHTHNAGGYVCTESTQSVLTCKMEEHTHSVEQGCFEPAEPLLVCDIPVHVHGDDCVIDEETGECSETAHVHSLENGCYVVTCVKPEHVHDGDSCVLSPETGECTLEEHTHSLDGVGCLPANPVVVCTIPEHTHTEECYTVTTSWTCVPPAANSTAASVAPSNGGETSGTPSNGEETGGEETAELSETALAFQNAVNAWGAAQELDDADAALAAMDQIRGCYKALTDGDKAALTLLGLDPELVMETLNAMALDGEYTVNGDDWWYHGNGSGKYGVEHLNEAISNSNGTFKVYIKADSVSFDRPVVIPYGKRVEVYNWGNNRTMLRSGYHSLFVVENGGDLLVGGDLTLDGGSGTTTSSLIDVQSGGTLTLDGSLKVKNAQTSLSGGGVYAHSDSTLTINSGVSFSNCSATQGNDVFVDNRVTFRNYATNINVAGPGVNSGKFETGDGKGRVYLTVNKNAYRSLPGEPSVVTGDFIWHTNANDPCWGSPYEITQNPSEILLESILESEDYIKDTSSQTWGVSDPTGRKTIDFLTATAKSRLETFLTDLANSSWANLTVLDQSGSTTTLDASNKGSYEIIPYVIKYQTEANGDANKIGWHIDCAVVPKTRVQLSYNLNLPNGVSTNAAFDVPSSQVKFGDLICNVESLKYQSAVIAVNETPIEAQYGNTGIQLTFTGWNTAADGSGTSYAPDETITVTKESTPVTLYAQWTVRQPSYTVAFYYGDGETAATTETRYPTIQELAAKRVSIKEADKTPDAKKPGYELDTSKQHAWSADLDMEGKTILKVYFKLPIQDAVTLWDGKEIKLDAETYTFAADGADAWESSNTDVATVGATGTITAVSAGKATITAKKDGNTIATCTVTVKHPSAWNTNTNAKYTAEELHAAVIPAADEAAREAALPVVGAGQTLQLLENIALKKTLEVTTTNAFTLDLDGHTLSLTATTGSVISIGTGGNMTLDDTSRLKNGTITGGKGTKIGGRLYGGGVYAADGAAFTMAGGTITGNTAKNDGGGVYAADGAAFTMTGGIITGNTAYDGGGVYATSNTTLTMADGTITENTASGGGGVRTEGSFIMNGGAITKNLAGFGGGVLSWSTGSFTMNDGEISGNGATEMGGGIFMCGSGSSVRINKGTISDNLVGKAGHQGDETKGGGICSCVPITMTGGTISGNGKAGSIGSTSFDVAQYGGGIALSDDAYLEMSGGEISDNYAKWGGGVTVGECGATYTGGECGIASGRLYLKMSGGKICKNHATETGGGVQVDYCGVAGSFIMTGGEISENTAGKNGGGVYVMQNALFEMSSGTITGNTATQNGGGVYDSGSFTMTGGVITGNTSEKSGGGVSNGSGITDNGTIVAGKATVEISAGAIHNNHAKESGDDIFNNGDGSSLTLSVAPAGQGWTLNDQGCGHAIDGWYHDGYRPADERADTSRWNAHDSSTPLYAAEWNLDNNPQTVQIALKAAHGIAATVTYPKFEDENGDGTPDKLPNSDPEEDQKDAVAPRVKIIVDLDGGEWEPTDSSIWNDKTKQVDGTYQYIAKSGETISLRENPTKAKNVFMGWTTEGVKEVDGIKTITYTAKWEPDTYGPTGPDDPTRKDEPDGIPDKWQVTVKYVSANTAQGEVTGSTTKVFTLGTAPNYATTGTITPGTSGVVTDGKGSYIFDRWDDPNPASERTVTGGETYTYTAKWRIVVSPTHTVTWVNWNGVQLQQAVVNNGAAEPGYTGTTPVRPSDGVYYYTFAGWSAPVVDAKNGNVTYTAQYTRTPVYYPGTDDPYYPPYTPATPATPGTTIPDNPSPIDPGTTINDQNVPLAGAVGLNAMDHFAYIAGYEDDTVRPTADITRAEVAAIFFRLMTEEFRVANWSTENTFSDVKAGDWYNNAVSTCVKAGIIRGYENGTFRPNQSITRAEFAAIAARFLGPDANDEGVGDFSDTAGKWYSADVRKAAKAGWIRGNGNRFEPDANISRAQVMAIVNRMLDRTPDADHMLPTMKTWIDNPEGTWYYVDVQEATNGHDYTRDETNIETWTAIQAEKNWTEIEAEWAANNGASASKDGVQPAETDGEAK